MNNAPLQLLHDVVIAGGSPGMHRAWPALAKAANGDLLVAYKESTDHNRTDDAVLMLARSSDGGQTWPYRKAVAAKPGYACYTNHALTPLADGTLLLNVKQARHVKGEDGEIRYRVRSSFTRSTDNGYRWDECGQETEFPFCDPAHRCGSYGTANELSDGRVMVPIFAIPRGERNGKLRLAAVAFSRDQCRTWCDAAIIHEDRRGDICPSETDILRLPDGRFLAMMRGNASALLYASYSADEGKTWSPAQATNLPGNCPALIYLASGAILCAYRDRTPGRDGMACAVSNDLGATWQPLGLLYHGQNFDCAYPSLVRLADDLLYCAYYTAAWPEAYTGVCEIHGLLLRDRSAG